MSGSKVTTLFIIINGQAGTHVLARVGEEGGVNSRSKLAKVVNGFLAPCLLDNYVPSSAVIAREVIKIL